MLEALIFDVDGTLAETERDGHRIAFNRAFDAFGLGWHWDVSLYGELLVVTGGKERIQYFIDRYAPALPEGEPIDGLIGRLHREKTHHFVSLLREGLIPLRPGIPELLREARQQGIRLAIATTTTPQNVSELLRVNLGDESVAWFEVIAAGDMVSRKKPDPAVYRLALERLGLPPAQCCAIEDSTPGLQAAKGAAIPTLITRSIYSRADEFDGALAVTDQLDELCGSHGETILDAIRRIHGRSVAVV